MDETHDTRHHEADDPPPRPSDTDSGAKRSHRWWLPTRRRAVVPGVAVLVLLAGGTGIVLLRDDPTTPHEAAEGTGTAAEAAFAFAECVRDQGVSDYPDPTIESDGGVFFEGVSRLSAPREQVRAAQETCRSILDEVRPTDGGGRHEVAPAAEGWERIVPGGDCRCADGSEYGFHVREADPERVVLFLDGGGACWSAETCAPGGDNEYQRTADGPDGEGVFDFADERNPFAGHSFVFVPYCTADAHLGDATTEYTADLTVEHRGAVNAGAALDHLTETFPDAAEVVVIGASAGSISAPLYAGLVSDRLPGADVMVVADSSGSYSDVPALNDILNGGAWGVGDAFPALPGGLDPGAGRWSAPGLSVRSGRYDPDIVFARYDHARDENQAVHLELAGVDGDDLLARIDANEALIEGAGVNVHSYTAPGDGHVVFGNDHFYTENVGGVALVDWITRLHGGEPVDDVRCTDCTEE
ncbi:pectin acetylesterase-family hydrolase [Nocardiopsis halotolerans]|uniref:pectin acetylesterase-family hydrolase n=1 Tax=Nocardiopsis halotolerans TaxID=124252 RepID=UPI0003499E46|nr:pectin acetylesterase-family hydrolase [Nocardiopsis halotolerans]